MSDDPRFTTSSGNIFEDMGLPNAKEHFVKARLVSKIMDAMEERALTKAATARILGVTPLQISNMARGQITRISIYKLMCYLVTLGHDVRIIVKPHRDSEQPAQLSVS